ncbi:aminotransferase class I/II-fold pyridoxal phosphate-dependent enzyme [Syntrophomonas palmitatica]|uniref:methionine gamma-lyase family protein n=1 Tax=Syntrophomonas palmitatica TaxID=402877 RepID=UPI000ADA29F8
MDVIRWAEEKLAGRFRELEEIAYNNQVRILQAFQAEKIRDTHFAPSTGYGYGDQGREALESVYARVFGSEDAMVRGQIASGTHAISACLFALLRPGDRLVSVTGSPYDTLRRVIGQNNNIGGTLVERGIIYDEIPFAENGELDWQAIAREAVLGTRMMLIQRSRGYSLRPPLNMRAIKEAVRVIKQNNPKTLIMLDNCYGEFVEDEEPGNYVDIMAGSLIKNPGGGLAPAGGYICGQKELVEQVSYQLTAPGLGKELGASLISNRPLFQGLFLAPHVVLQALKGAVLLAYVFSEAGYQVHPDWDEHRADIVQAIELKNEDEVLKFCQLVQSSSPVDSDLRLEYAPMAGYQDKIVMAAGTFVQGSSIELSCDAPMRKPYCAYLQGGLSYEHCRYVVSRLIEELI